MHRFSNDTKIKSKRDDKISNRLKWHWHNISIWNNRKIYNFIKCSISLGRLVQWKNVRFVNFAKRRPRFDPRRGPFFSDAWIRNVCLTEFSTLSDGFFQSRNLDSKSCTRQLYYCMKRNVALEIGPMTSHLKEWMTSYTLLRNSIQQYKQPGAVSYAFKLTAGTNRMTEEQCLRPSDRESESERERGLQAG